MSRSPWRISIATLTVKCLPRSGARSTFQLGFEKPGSDAFPTRRGVTAVDPFHRQLAQIGLEAAGRYGFVLAGGYAVQAHGFLTRPSEDIDLFTSVGEQDIAQTAADDAVDKAVTTTLVGCLASGREDLTFLRK